MGVPFSGCREVLMAAGFSGWFSKRVGLAGGMGLLFALSLGACSSPPTEGSSDLAMVVMVDLAQAAADLSVAADLTVPPDIARNPLKTRLRYTGANQTFMVPADTTKVNVKL